MLNAGHTVYLIDPPQRGRSPTAPSSLGGLNAFPLASVESIFTAPEKFPNASTAYPQARLHTQWPGSGLRGDSIFDGFFASQVQLQQDPDISDALVRDALNALIDKVGKVILITHSQAGPYGWVAGDARPDHVKAIIAIEPEGPPFVQLPILGGKARTNGLTRLPLQYDPPVEKDSDLETEVIQPSEDFKDLRNNCTVLKTPRKLANLSKVFVALVTGEASYHARYEWCTYELLKQTGVQVDWLDLGLIGQKGNGHFSFLEKNSDDIASLVSESLKAFFTPKNATAGTG